VVSALPLLVSRAEFLEAAGLSDRQLNDALRARRLFTLALDGGEYIPEFFLGHGHDRRQLQSVCKVLGDLPAGSKLQFFMTPKGSLSAKTPLDALKEGKAAAVRRAARGFVER
jgi:hypothetical protein